MIHSAIHAARPDVNCAAHSHSVYGRAFSTLGRELEPLTQDACAFYNVCFICSGLWRVVILSDTERLILLRITSCIAPTEESYWRSKRVRILPDCLETKRSVWFFLFIFVFISKTCVFHRLPFYRSANFSPITSPTNP